MIPTTAKQLAEYLQTDAYNLRNQLEAANGQINFDRSTDQLNAEQLAKWLPRYLEGKSQLKGEKRQRVERLLTMVNGSSLESITTETTEQITTQPTQVQRTQPMEQQRTKQIKLPRWIETTLALLPILPLPTLGIAASYGVYHFASNFAPQWIAVFEAVGFELVYIGLSTLRDVPDKFRKRVVGVSVGAVFVSVVYNTFSAWQILDPNLFVGLKTGWQVLISIAHGTPLALLGYFVADLISALKNQRK